MYFVKDNSREDGVVYFINPKFSLAQVYKLLLPRKVQFLDSREIKGFLTLSQKRDGLPSYFVFRKKDKPDFCGEDEIVWDESGCGICRVR